MKENKQITYWIIFGLIIFFSVLGYNLNKPNDKISFNLSLGIMSSILASFIYGFITYKLVKKPFDEKLKLEHIVTELKNRELNGINSIQEKFLFNPTFWFNVIRESNNGFDIMGHSLYKWFEEPYRKLFLEKLNKIIENDKIVRIVILEPALDSNKNYEECERKYNSLIIRTLKYLKSDILDKTEITKRQNLQVRFAPYYYIPYMFIKTDNQILVSHYYLINENRNNIMFCLENESKYAISYINDFEETFKLCKQTALDYYIRLYEQ